MMRRNGVSKLRRIVSNIWADLFITMGSRASLLISFAFGIMTTTAVSEDPTSGWEQQCMGRRVGARYYEYTKVEV